MKPVAWTLALAAAAVACGGGEGSYHSAGAESPDAPEVLFVSPSAIAVGDEVQIVGQNFVAPEQGRTIVTFRGTFYDEERRATDVDLQIEPTYVNATQMSWKMLPDVRFHPAGGVMGNFLGVVQVRNQYMNGTDQTSKERNASIEIKPSLVLRALRPAGSECELVVPGTIAEQPMALLVEAIGLTPGTPEAPLVFQWGFDSRHWEVQVDSNGTLDHTSGIASDGVLTIEDRLTKGLISGVQDGSRCGTSQNVGDLGGLPIALTTMLGVGWAQGSWSGVTTALLSGGGIAMTTFFHKEIEGFLNGLCSANKSGEKRYFFKYLQDLMGTSSGLQVLKTKPISTGNGTIEGASSHNADGRVTTNIYVSARDANGRTASLVVPIDIYQEITTKRDISLDRIVERDPPEMVVASCVPGGMLEREISYRQSQSASRSRGKDFQWSSNVTANTGTPNFTVQLNFAQTFGVNENTSVTTGEDFGRDLSTKLLPGQFASFYRQAVKIERIARVMGHNRCGKNIEYGLAKLYDWEFTPEIATGSSCPPKSYLPPAGRCTGSCEPTTVVPSATP